ncbi:MAG: acyl-CoA synthetase [Cognatishimia activa]
MLNREATIAATREAFQWDVPEFYNIGFDVCDKWASVEPDRLALIDIDAEGEAREYSFDDLRQMSSRFAHVLSGCAQPGDRIGVLLPQCVEAAVSHIAIYKMGGIAQPLFTLFGPDALAYRLQDSGASVVVTNAQMAEMLESIRQDLPALKTIISIDGPDGDIIGFHEASAVQRASFAPVNSRADDPAVLIYTSGTTGNPKGALHAHRVLLGHLPGIEMSHDFFPKPGDKIWTPADWAWIGGLLDVLLPALHHGVPVVACRFQKFSAEAAFDLIKSQGIRNAFLPPTAIKMMRQYPDAEKFGIKMRSVASGGEALGDELIAWGQKALGVTINEFYGQTECNMIVSSCADLAAPEPGVMGFAVPGHEVDVLDTETGQPLGVDEQGDIAVRSPDPVMFLRYWNRPEATSEKFRTVDGVKWLLTGDQGRKTPSGRIAFVGRDDDVINSSGYRIGPAEIEHCLLTHPAVAMAGVVGKPDELRGEIVTGFIQLAEGFAPSDELAQDISNYVKTRLAAYEYPRKLHFIDQMPLTTTSKIIRGDLRKLLLDQSSGA